MKKSTLLLISLLIFIPVAFSQNAKPIIDLTNKKKLIIVYKNGVQIELTNWGWFYKGDDYAAVNRYFENNRNINSDPLSRKNKKPAMPPVPDTTTGNLMLNMKALNVDGVSLNDFVLSENDFSSIKFIWKDRDTGNIALDKVVISLTNGKTIELPRLDPPNGYIEMTLEGNTNINGFSGKFSKRLDGGGYLTNSAPSPIIEIRVQ
jgi:hypothetical protein